jgi:hypothetical protein
MTTQKEMMMILYSLHKLCLAVVVVCGCPLSVVVVMASGAEATNRNANSIGYIFVCGPAAALYTTASHFVVFLREQ